MAASARRGPLHAVVTGVRSLTHLVHVASYLRHELAQRTGEVTVAHVGGGTFLGRASVTEDDVRRLLPQDDRLHLSFPEGPDRWQLPEGQDAVYVAVGAPGLKPWAQLRRAHPRRRVPVVVTDEGLGTYGDWRTRRDAWARQGVPEPWRSVRTAAVTAGTRTLTSRRWPLYVAQQGRWAVVDDVAAEFRRHTAQVTPTSDRRRVVLATQPWVDLGLLDEASYLAHIDQVLTGVDRAGGRLVVRPHPAEPPERYAGLNVLPGHGPAELDPDVVRAAAVVGGSSTAVLNLAAVHGLQAVRLTPPRLEHLDRELGEQQRTLLEALAGPVVAAEHLHQHLRLA
ncbi:hypothetical protein [Luteipulveratus halotolerans]|uniref:Polysaccharide pyruvyl transferase domain-containing protein n=1 Tax=Luteipulveratus halotolerans TaxID=1631356 RepID=A0A0L6CJQ6_9MICO|nr:hypothetical protein [Luteipulveratus halotolerans]KNX37753.1 hypothetical protein VV01_12300 [Luteipulveratus halotolerans]